MVQISQNSAASDGVAQQYLLPYLPYLENYEADKSAFLAGDLSWSDLFTDYVDEITVYHYTHIDRLDSINERGLVPPMIAIGDETGVFVLLSEFLEQEDEFMRENYGRARLTISLPISLLQGDATAPGYERVPAVLAEWIEEIN